MNHQGQNRRSWGDHFSRKLRVFPWSPHEKSHRFFPSNSQVGPCRKVQLGRGPARDSGIVCICLYGKIRSDMIRSSVRWTLIHDFMLLIHLYSKDGSRQVFDAHLPTGSANSVTPSDHREGDLIGRRGPRKWTETPQLVRGFSWKNYMNKLITWTNRYK